MAQISNALHFNGTNSRLGIGNNALLNSSHITVRAWVKFDNVDGWAFRGIVTK